MKKKVLGLLGLLCAGLMLCGCHRRLYQQPAKPMGTTVTGSNVNYASRGTALEVSEREVTDDQTGALSKAALAVLNETMTEED